MTENANAAGKKLIGKLCNSVRCTLNAQPPFITVCNFLRGSQTTRQTSTALNSFYFLNKLALNTVKMYREVNDIWPPVYHGKFSAPTFAFLAFWLAKKLRLLGNSRSFTLYGK